MIRNIRASVLVALAAFAPASFAGNIVPNPDFSQWLTDWSAASGPLSTSFDDGSPTPPSAIVYGIGTTPDSDIASPCIAIDASSRIDFSFQTRVAAGSASAAVIGYSDEACTQSVGSLETDTIDASPDWQTISQTDLALPPGTRFVKFEFYARHSQTSPFANAYLDHVAVGPTGTLPAAIPIDQWGLTGAWYDPDESGQGFQLTFDPVEGTLFGAWYTYDVDAGGSDSQRWYSLQASLASDDVSADVTIYRNTGGTFDGPPRTMAIAVGTGTLAFDSCTSGTFAYTLDDGREGSIRIRTLVPLSQCAEVGSSVIEPGPPGLSGTWYEPSTGGQGVMITIDPYLTNVFAGWYTYAPGAGSSGVDGQRWFSAQGNYGTKGSPVSLTLYESTGGVFDASNAVSTVAVGSATLTFASCEIATLDYTFTSGELAGKSGSIPLTRLGAAPESCTLPGAN